MVTSAADFFIPERIAHRNLGEAYAQYPFASRVGLGSIATVTGFLKPFLAPIIAAIGTVVMPILACIRVCKGDSEGAKGYFKAWRVCFLTLIGATAFMLTTAYFLPLIASTALVVSLCALSIIFHVREMMKDPE